MERTCARAVELGLPAIAFTEHVDHTAWRLPPGTVDVYESLADPDRVVTPPELDVAGYLAAIEMCRERFPDVRILTGLEVGEPHWHSSAVAKLLASGSFDRVLGSQHCLPDGGGYAAPPGLYQRRDAADVVREYLAEVARLIAESDTFAVLAHIDFPVRFWPAGAGPFDANTFEDEFRHALRLLAETGRVLEVNTRVPLSPAVVRWWWEEGGTAVTFGSDAHDPIALTHGFGEAAAMVEAQGFRPGRYPHDFWVRSS
jgi:histidinol-phosphatase (PHP family)